MYKRMFFIITTCLLNTVAIAQTKQDVVIVKKGILPLLVPAKVLMNDSILIGRLLGRDMINHSIDGKRTKISIKRNPKHYVYIEPSVPRTYVLVEYNFLTAFFAGSYSVSSISPEEFDTLYQKRKWVRRLSNRLGVR